MADIDCITDSIGENVRLIIIGIIAVVTMPIAVTAVIQWASNL